MTGSAGSTSNRFWFTSGFPPFGLIGSWLPCPDPPSHFWLTGPSPPGLPAKQVFVKVSAYFDLTLGAEILSRTLRLIGATSGGLPHSSLFFLPLLYSSLENCHIIMQTLNYYCSFSGQAVNLVKSRLALSTRLSSDAFTIFLVSSGYRSLSGHTLFCSCGVPFFCAKLGRQNPSGKLFSYAMPILFYAFGHCPACFLFEDLHVRCFIWNHPPEVRKWHYIGWLVFFHHFQGSGRCGHSWHCQMISSFNSGLFRSLLILISGGLLAFGLNTTSFLPQFGDHFFSNDLSMLITNGRDTSIV